jgi:hypothetical protein
MNLDELQKKLIAAARKDPPGDEVPFAFEQRIMARLPAAARPEEWLLWLRPLWCGAGVCAAVAVFMSVWSFSPDPDHDLDLASHFSQEIEHSILGWDDTDSLQ